jgi:hypothetical protein
MSRGSDGVQNLHRGALHPGQILHPRAASWGANRPNGEYDVQA